MRILTLITLNKGKDLFLHSFTQTNSNDDNNVVFLKLIQMMTIMWYFLN